MSDDEDDYLSDKFLNPTAKSSRHGPKTYSERRKEAHRVAAIKNEQNRKKSRKQLEEEARQEGLSKSLFERAKEEEETGVQNKAFAMMLKMGFKPGQSLGRNTTDERHVVVPAEQAKPEVVEPAEEKLPEDPPRKPQKNSHLVEPLPLNEWAGKKGIGLGKRPASPTGIDRLSKIAKAAEVDADAHGAFRDRTRQEYEERRAEGLLTPVQLTCTDLDEKAGLKFNMFWLNSNNSNTFPEGLLDVLMDHSRLPSLTDARQSRDVEERLRTQMRADALVPLDRGEDNDDATPATPPHHSTPYNEGDIEEATQFLSLPAKDRLKLVMDYLRERYSYCFWCGTQYENREDMEENCPGPNEDDH